VGIRTLSTETDVLQAQGCDGVNPNAPAQTVPVEWSFKARKAVTNSRSWYEWSVWPVSSQTGTNRGGSSFATYTNIRQGQTLRYSEFLPTYCRGTYSITVGFMAAAPPGQTDDDASGGTPGHDGSLIVGQRDLRDQIGTSAFPHGQDGVLNSTLPLTA
jgi:hypothetical protein